jgi:hypothetical protein
MWPSWASINAKTPQTMETRKSVTAMVGDIEKTVWAYCTQIRMETAELMALNEQIANLDFMKRILDIEEQKIDKALGDIIESTDNLMMKLRMQQFAIKRLLQTQRGQNPKPIHAPMPLNPPGNVDLAIYLDKPIPLDELP